jgi:hypothetical protein
MYFIYKVHHLSDETHVYYGKTHTSLKRRLLGHKTLYRSPSSAKYKGSSCRILFDYYGIDNCIITELARCETNEEASQLEREYVMNHPCVNRCTPLQSQQEWFEKNKEYRKAYHRNNDKKRAEKRKQKFVCSCGREVSYRHRYDHYKTQFHIKQQIYQDQLVPNLPPSSSL